MSAACVRTPDHYPVPEQHFPLRAQTSATAEFIAMGDAAALQAIVRDVNKGEQGAWRWTGADPELRFTLASPTNRTLIVEFAIHDRTFRETGPVTISFYVNGKLAGQEHYTTHGDKSFEKLIPAEWLLAQRETRVRLVIDKPWTSPDGETLGVLLKRIGFVE